MTDLNTTSKTGLALGDRLSESELCPDALLAGQEAAFARDIERLQARTAEFVPVQCPACNDANGSGAFDKYGFNFKRCDNCSTIYMSPRPSEAVMSDYYANSENYAYWAKHIFPASEAARREKIHKPWLQRVIGYCHAFGVPKGTLLEVGPGFGTFASVATESGEFARVVAVEPTPELAQACRARGVEVINKRIEDIGAEIPQANVVVAFEVIEHLFDPRRFLVDILQIVVPGGLVIVSCPNGLGFDIAMLGAGALAVDAEHVNLFNPSSLTSLMNDCGFEVLKTHTPGRLDAEFVREAALKGEISLDSFLQRVLVDEWDEHGWPFQQFIAQQGLSSHMWLVARRPV
jgi:2-polyprenyl-3-methyl-5-hydroxy-6-metoxy-1,4-benzoquinol methylase